MSLKTSDNSAIVVLSGGQDSATCLAIAKQKHKTVRAIGFDYGQRHSIELECAARFCKEMAVPFEVIKVPALSDLNDSALIGNDGDVCAAHHGNDKLPASFVPARNALFLTIAHGYAQKHKAGIIYTGVCETDYSGYPDCRSGFINSLNDSLNLGYECNILIVTPLMWLDKAATFKAADDLGVLDQIVELTHTCYNGVRDKRYEWGYGCNECPACDLRAKGYAEFKKKKVEVDG